MVVRARALVVRGATLGQQTARLKILGDIAHVDIIALIAVNLCFQIFILGFEVVVFFLRCWIVRDGYDFKETFSDVPKCFLAMGISLAAGMLWPWQIPSAFINMMVKSLVIMALYLAILWLLKFDLNEDLVTIVKKRLKKVAVNKEEISKN